ncbi:MAG: FliM/FliN family flagellar motor switch protein [Planctomycetota bacterium]|jgi:flagellar motor switch protein FliM
MTESSAPTLSGSKIQQLLNAVGSAPAAVEPASEATVYNWCDPHYFDEDQRNRLAAVMTQVAALLSGRFAHFYQSEFDVKVVSITQHFADGLSRQVELDRSFSLPFGPDAEHPCGFLAVAAQTALGWAARLLGDAEAGDDPDRTVSSLEESLLTDLLTAVTQAFLASLGGAHDLHPGSELFKGTPVMPCEPTTQLCHVVFQVQEADANAAEIQLVLPCETLAPLVGKPLAPQSHPPQEQLARLLMEHVYDIPVAVTARLATTWLSFQDVLDLATDDILLIEKPIEEPVDLIIGNRVVFRGSPAQSAGQYAVFVTECTANAADASQASPPAN